MSRGQTSERPASRGSCHWGPRGTPATCIIVSFVRGSGSGSIVPSAGPIAPSQVAGSANWVVHIDNQLLKTSRIGQFIRAELANAGIEQKIQDFATISSFNPLDDIRDITLYGTGTDRNKAAMLLDAEFDVEKIVALLGMNPQYQAIAHGDLTIHKWVDEKRQSPDDPTAGVAYGAFVNDVTTGA